MLFASRPVVALSVISLLAAAILSQAAGAGEHAHYTAKPDRPEIAVPGICPPGWRPATPPLNPALGCLPNTLYLPPGRDGAPDIPEGKCPGGWEPVTPPLNPMLICKPKNEVSERGGPRPGRIHPDCPDGWMAVTPPLNRALICLPGRIVATLPGTTRPGLPPGECPKGWWPVTPPTNPVLGCLPNTFVTP